MALLVELELQNKERKNNIKNIWAVHLKAEKLSCLTYGKFDFKTLVTRGRFKAIIKKVPHTSD
ncbi:6245_t:CDS:2, partial [Gigaspora margarita]